MILSAYKGPGQGLYLVAGLLQELSPGWQRPQDLVPDIARLHGLLELAWDDEVALLAEQLTSGDLPRRVVLDHAAFDAYQRVTDRIIGIMARRRPTGQLALPGRLTAVRIGAGGAHTTLSARCFGRGGAAGCRVTRTSSSSRPLPQTRRVRRHPGAARS